MLLLLQPGCAGGPAASSKTGTIQACQGLMSHLHCPPSAAGGDRALSIAGAAAAGALESVACCRRRTLAPCTAVRCAFPGQRSGASDGA